MVRAIYYGTCITILLFAFWLIVQLLPTVLFKDDFYVSARYLSDNPFFPQTNPINELTWGSDWRRQLLIHPPLLLSFYWLWVRIVGSTPLALHIPPFLALGVGCFYWWKIASSSIRELRANPLIWITLWYSCFSILIFSAQAIYAPFECAYLGFAIFQLQHRQIQLKYRIGVHLLGVLLFYHYLFFWLIDAVSTILLKSVHTALTNCILFLLTGSIALWWYYSNVSTNQYQWTHWVRLTLDQFLTVFSLLPYAVYL